MNHEELVATVVALQARVASLETGRTAKADAKRVADDEDLDGRYGDPDIRYPLKEKYWKAQPDENVGKRFSECSPEYLDATAKYLSACEYMASKNGEDDKARYKERDAARARGWACRLRNGWLPAASADEAAGFADAEGEVHQSQYDDSDIPFAVNMTVTGEWWQP